KARGQLSPGRAARAVLMSAESPIAEGMARARAIYSELVLSDQAAALRHAFFAEREPAKVPGLDGVAPREVSVIGIARAGTMGSGIAVACLDAGYKVIAVEQSEAAAQAGKGRIAGLYDRAIKSKRMTEADRLERLARLTISAERGDFAPADLF